MSPKIKLRHLAVQLTCIVLGLAALTGLGSPVAAQAPEIQGVSGVRAAIAQKGRLSIIAELAPGAAGSLSRSGVATMRARLAQQLTPAGVGSVRGLGSLPYVAVEVTPRQLDALLASGLVRGVAENAELRPQLTQSVPLIAGPAAWKLGARGAGRTIVIMDSGVQASHPFFGNRVVRSICSADDCGSSIVDEPGAGEPNPGCDHGTHVAGIAAGQGSAISGVAPEADIISIRVLACGNTLFEYVIRGLDYVYTDLGSAYAIDSVNISLGNSARFSGSCDDASATYQALATAINNLRSIGIATVAASGNSGYNGSIAAPACIDNAIAVGSTTKADQVSSFSNSGPNIDLLAPGSDIYSSVLNAGFGYKSGTSMAAPHVAGAFAAIRSTLPNATVGQIEQALETTGKPVTDADSGISRPRINVYDALLALGVSPGPSWHNWEVFGGSLKSGPECLATSATQIDCWAVLADGSLGWWRYNGKTAPTAPTSPSPTAVTAPPSCLHAGGKLHCFAPLASGQLGQTTFGGTGWTSLGDNVRGRPACVSVDGTAITCVTRNGGNKLRTRTWSGTGWGAWTSLAGAVTVGAPPTCFARAGGIDCVVADTANRLQYLRRSSTGSWAAAASLAGTVKGVASCFAAATTTRTCFLQGTDRTLRSIYFNGTKWGTWENLGGALYSEPTCVRFNGAETHCFAVAISGGLQQKSKIGGKWGAWGSIDGSLVQYRPTCVAPTGGARMDCFARGTSNALAHRAYY